MIFYMCLSNVPQIKELLGNQYNIYNKVLEVLQLSSCNEIVCFNVKLDFRNMLLKKYLFILVFSFVPAQVFYMWISLLLQTKWGQLKSTLSFKKAFLCTMPCCSLCMLYYFFTLNSKFSVLKYYRSWIFRIDWEWEVPVLIMGGLGAMTFWIKSIWLWFINLGGKKSLQS